MKYSHRHSTFLLLLICLSISLLNGITKAAESSRSWPIGPIGGRITIWDDANYLKLQSITPNAPAETAGLKVNDFIIGAYSRPFDPIGLSFVGAMQQLGHATDYALSTDGKLPLTILRPGSGYLEITLNLPVTGGLHPYYFQNSPHFDAMYETSCKHIFNAIQATDDGIAGYPGVFAGIALLGHPDWNKTTGEKPYAIAINKLLTNITNYVNQESWDRPALEYNFLDGTRNTNPSSGSQSNWYLGQYAMFLAEYYKKSGDQSVLPTLQRAAQICSQNIQYWKQESGRGYDSIGGMTGHAGVGGDYNGGGINMSGLHLFAGIAMAKQAGIDVSARPRDGKDYGFNLEPGDPIPAEIEGVFPPSIILPFGAEDPNDSSPHVDNLTNAPRTTITDPLHYNLSVSQKYWLQRDNLKKCTSSPGHVNYGRGYGAAYDSGGRTIGTFFGVKAWDGSTGTPEEHRDWAERLENNATEYHDRRLNAHAYNAGGSFFGALAMPMMTDLNQRYLLENLKYYHLFMQEPSGTIAKFDGREYGDPYMDNNLVANTTIALSASAARGRLTTIPSFDQNRIATRILHPHITWPKLSERLINTSPGIEKILISVTSANGNNIPANDLKTTWNVLEGPKGNEILPSNSIGEVNLDLNAPGIYLIQINSQQLSTGFTTTETIRIIVTPNLAADLESGSINYEIYTGTTGYTISSLINHPTFPTQPDITKTLTSFQGNYSDNNYGSRISGYIIPPITGNYHLYISSDDASSLRLNSTGRDPSGATEIASCPNAVAKNQWTTLAQQKSAPIPLEAGKPYFIEALHIEGAGQDHLQIAWTLPNSDSINIIDSAYIARQKPITPAASITKQPTNIQANLGDSISFQIEATGPEPRFYQWRLNGENFGKITAENTISFENASSHQQGTWDCVYTSGDSVIISESATLSINNYGQPGTASLWQEIYYNVPGSSISDLTTHPSYLKTPSASGPLDTTSVGTLGDSYGQRWTGWFTAPRTGKIKFLLTGDDRAELFLSPNDKEAYKKSIVYLARYVSQNAWSQASSSNFIDVIAGQRYYIELLHKEAGGGDHVAFTWIYEGEEIPTNGTEPNNTDAFDHKLGGGSQQDLTKAPPIAKDDSLRINNPSTEISVLDNDDDLDKTSLTITSITQPSGGQTLINGSKITYILNNGFSGNDSFTYTIQNQYGITATATVDIYVPGENILIANPNGQPTNAHDTLNWSELVLPSADIPGFIQSNALINSNLHNFDLTIRSGLITRQQNSIGEWTGDTDIIIEGGTIDLTAPSPAGNSPRSLRLRNTSSITIAGGNLKQWNSGNIEMFDTSSIIAISGTLQAGGLGFQSGYNSTAISFQPGDAKVILASKPGSFNQAKIDFQPTSRGQLTINGADKAYFENLWNSKTLTFNKTNEGQFSDHFYVENSTLTLKQPPVLEGSSMEIAEGAYPGVSLGFVTAIKQSGTASWSLNSQPNPHFEIDANTGEVRVLVSPIYDTQNEYQFTVTLTDDTGLSTTAPLTIAVIPAGNQDNDHDGLDSFTEIELGTDPNQADTDGDGYSDGFEIAWATDPLDPNKKPATNLAAWWNFDNGSLADTSYDIVGSVVGTLKNGATKTADGMGRSGNPGDRALDLGTNGAQQHMEILNAQFLRQAASDQAMTISFWQKLDSTSNGTSSFWVKSPSAGSDQRGLQAHTPWTDNKIYFDAGGASSTQRIDTSTGTTDWKNWNHLALVRKPNGTAEIWLNGTLIATKNNLTNLLDDYSSLILGSSADLNNTLRGKLDDFAVFNTDLSETEINQLASGTNPTSINQADAWTNWQNTHFSAAQIANGLAAPNEDFDGDGLNNLLEHALGTSPSQLSSHHMQPKMNGTDSVEMSFTRPTGMDHLTYIGEYSDNLKNWLPATLTRTQTGLTETWKISSPMGEPKCFIRLRVDVK